MNRFAAWRRLHVTDSGYVLLLSLMTGVLTGVCAWLLKLMIDSLTRLASGAVTATGLRCTVVVIPVVGIGLAALFCRYVLRQGVDNGVARLVSDLKTGDRRLSGKTVYGSMIASALTLGAGGSAGSEGPIAYAGAGIGSRIGLFLRVKPSILTILVACGAAAGIAGIFKAPIGGALFAFEVLRVELSSAAVLAVFLATLTSAMTAYMMSDCTLDIAVLSPGAFDNGTLLWTALLGIVCGIYSLYYTRTGSLTKRFLTTRSHAVTAWVASGLITGVMILLFPSLYGEGYGVISSVINSTEKAIGHDGIMALWDGAPWTLAAACAGILLLKGAGSSAANNGGGVAGDFAPTLFAGCILGLLYATGIDAWGAADINSAHYALIAMAGVMAGVIRAPLMAIFLTTEMVGGIDFLLPSSISALISYWIVMLFTRDTFYHSGQLTMPGAG